jgi:hypothetical protein
MDRVIREWGADRFLRVSFQIHDGDKEMSRIKVVKHLVQTNHLR